MPESISTENPDVAMILAAVELSKRVTVMGQTGNREDVAATYKAMYTAVYAAWKEAPTASSS